MSATRGIAIFVYSIEGSLVNNFSSATQAGKFFNSDNKTILRYSSNNKLYKEKWFLSFTKR